MTDKWTPITDESSLPPRPGKYWVTLPNKDVLLLKWTILKRWYWDITYECGWKHRKAPVAWMPWAPEPYEPEVSDD